MFCGRLAPAGESCPAYLSAGQEFVVQICPFCRQEARRSINIALGGGAQESKGLLLPGTLI